MQAQLESIVAPALPEAMPHIPAMTTEAERSLYYRLVRENAHRGAVVELGAWLGASSAWIAAGMRDSGTGGKAHVYDRFRSKPGHAAKVAAFYANHGGEGEMVLGDCERQFRANLGPLLDHVEIHRGEIAEIEWTGGPISVLITDAPKRVPEISAVLTRLRHALMPGAIMAWQDFCHFPSYEIPACLYRLRDHLEFVEAAVPGTTLAFRVTSSWDAEEVSPKALAVDRWTFDEITCAWGYWLRMVAPEKAALFSCGALLFLCDIGLPDEARFWLGGVYAQHAEAILPKWRYLRAQRPDLVRRYAPLFDFLRREGALD
jgi:hypothetical protein